MSNRRRRWAVVGHLGALENNRSNVKVILLEGKSPDIEISLCRRFYEVVDEVSNPQEEDK